MGQYRYIEVFEGPRFGTTPFQHTLFSSPVPPPVVPRVGESAKLCRRRTEIDEYLRVFGKRAPTRIDRGEHVIIESEPEELVMHVHSVEHGLDLPDFERATVVRWRFGPPPPLVPTYITPPPKEADDRLEGFYAIVGDDAQLLALFNSEALAEEFFKRKKLSSDDWHVAECQVAGEVKIAGSPWESFTK